MNVLKDEGKAALPRVILAKAGFTDGASGRIEKKGAIVSFAVVVASGAKTKRRAKNQDSGRKSPPRE